MKPENFCYWLKGYFELTDTDNLNPEQVAVIKEHLALSFNNVTVEVVTKSEKPMGPPNELVKGSRLIC